jgi:hypothetical protein
MAEDTGPQRSRFQRVQREVRFHYQWMLVNDFLPKIIWQPVLQGQEPRHLGLEPVSADIRTSLCSRAGIPRGKSLARPETGGGILGDTSRFRATETGLSGGSGGKAAESQRLFRPRRETGIARDCVVELVGLEPAAERL